MMTDPASITPSSVSAATFQAVKQLPPGVQFTDPPARLILDVSRHINEVLATLPENTQGAVVGIVTDRGINVAVVHKFNDTFAVSTWIGKDWGSKVTGGAMVRATW